MRLIIATKFSWDRMLFTTYILSLLLGYRRILIKYLSLYLTEDIWTLFRYTIANVRFNISIWVSKHNVFQ